MDRVICAVDGRKYYWRVIDYLQRDAKRLGVLKGNLRFGSFWHNISSVTHNIMRLFIALDKRNRVLGYMVVENLDSSWKEDIPIVEIIEVLPQYRRRGIGTAMMQWAIERTRAKSSLTMRLNPLEGKEAFFTRLGFAKTERKGYVLTL